MTVFAFIVGIITGILLKTLSDQIVRWVLEGEMKYPGVEDVTEQDIVEEPSKRG